MTSPASPPTPASTESALSWQPLTVLIVYRLVLASLPLLLSISSGLPQPLGGNYPELFLLLSGGYLLFAVLCMVALLRRKPAFQVQIYVQVLLDIIFISLLMYASGGINSGLSILLVVAIAAGGILTHGRSAILFAIVATLATFAVQIYANLQASSYSGGYTQAAMFGAAFFATAILTHQLAKRTLASETLASQRGTDLAEMAALTEYVIERMQTGIIVLDESGNTRLTNQSAWRLLGLKPQANSCRLAAISSELAAELLSWRSTTPYKPNPLRIASTSAEILPRFAALGHDYSSGTLIFLEDTSGITQQAQQMKLASLVQLTASIAHEIRNPLAAISHAGELLAESTVLDAGDARLTQIIHTQSRRMNRIVENMLQLSRRERSQLENFELSSWLEDFIDDFTRNKNIFKLQVAAEHVSQGSSTVRMDPSQLQQILWNLCENGLRYSTLTAIPQLKLRYGILAESQTPFLDVIDFGPGISPELAPRLFEPFFTTEQQGTGLGLYIARELCECNQARLSYIALPDGGSCFRITFADPRRRQLG